MIATQRHSLILPTARIVPMSIMRIGVNGTIFGIALNIGISSAKTSLGIASPGYSMSRAGETFIDRSHQFRTPYGRFQNSDKGQDAVKVALSTAAAPMYFSPVTTRHSVVDILAVDGGVWANSPVSVAIAEATAELKIPIERIRVLNIGTTHTRN
jgi:hypothetical protein